MRKIIINYLLFIFAFCTYAEIHFTGLEENLHLVASFTNPVISKINFDSENFRTIEFSECSPTFVSGFNLPVHSQLVALPNTGNYRITNSDFNYHDFSLNEKISPFESGFKPDYTKDEWFPNAVIRVESPAIMRGERFTQISVFPVQYNPARNILRIYDDINAEFEIDYNDTRNPRLNNNVAGGLPGVKNLIYGSAANRNSAGGSYLIIAPQNCEDVLQPYLRWKEKLGFKTKLAILEEIGTTEADVKDYLQNAYDTWENPPDYVILVGDVTGNFYMPAFFVPGYLHPWAVTDHSYTLLDGDDYFPDLLIGRFSIQNEMQLTTILSKLINYEKDPYLATDWIKSALMVGYVDESNGFSQREVLLSIRDKLLNFEYTRVDTFIAPWQFGQTLLETEINHGHSFICYRGAGHSTYWSGGYQGQMFTINNIYNLNNGYMLPMVTSMTCGGGDFAADETDSCFGEVWLSAGSPTLPQGAVGFIGPSERDTKTWFNNANAMGIYQGITQEGINTCGEMLLRGKMELYNNFPFGHEMGGSEDSDQFYFFVYNLLGDPGLRVWTDTPQNLEVEFDPVYSGSNFISAQVITADDKAEFKIAFTNSDSLIAVGYTDETGNINLPISVPEGFYQLTASKYGYIPKTVDVQVLASNMLTLQDYTFSEATCSGNELDIDLQILNMSDLIATDVTLELLSQDNNIFINSDPIFIDSISANQSFNCSFSILISDTWQNDVISELILEMTSNLGENLALIPVEINSPELSMTEYQALTNSGFIQQEEETFLNLKLYNSGQISSAPFQAELLCLNNNVEILDRFADYPEIAVGESQNNLTPFKIYADNSVISGETAALQLKIISLAETLQTINFEIPIGVISQTSPTFCNWGYYAIESEDEGNFEAPEYDWLELDPDLGGNGILVEPDYEIIDGYIKTIPLPFQFRYFGKFYNEISICSEGWLAMGRTDHIFFRNRTIPSGVGPDAMIAPFWDSLEDGEIYVAHDLENHRFIIEWSDWGSSYDPSLKNTFEVILLDPEYQQNFGADSPLIFQYKEIHNIDQGDHYATIGIENETQTQGLLLTFAGLDAPTFHPVQNEKAIFFTMKNNPNVPYLTIEPISFEVNSTGDSLITRSLFLENNSTSGETLNYELSFTHFSRNRDASGHFVRNIENDFLMQGSSIYVPFEPYNQLFYLYHNSPDGEAIRSITLDFPLGCEVNTAQDIGDLVWNGQTGNGVQVTWGDNSTTISPLTIVPFTINLTVNEDLIPPLELNWQIDGDGSGNEPHQVSGTISLYPTTDEVFWISYPNGGENVLPAVQDTIRWNHFGVADSVKIELSRDNGNTWQILANNVPNIEQYPFVFNGPLSQHCLIKVGTLDDSFFDISDAEFQITSLNIVYPNESTVMSYSKPDSILWQDVAGLETIDVSISFDHGFTWQILEQNVPNTGVYHFEVPGPASQSCQIKLSNEAFAVESFSDLFEIADTPITWLAASSYDGSIEPSENEEITVSFSTEDLEFGTYSAFIKIETQLGQILFIPVSLYYDEPSTPISEVKLYQNYPNPFHPFTRIDYDLPEECLVELSIFNVRGQLVKTITHEIKAAGTNYEYWNGTDKFQQPVSSGVYYYRLKAGKTTRVKKMILVK